MAKLVREQNREKRKRERNAELQHARMQNRLHHGHKRIVIGRERLYAVGIRSREFCTDGECRNNGEKKEQQGKRDGTAARTRRNVNFNGRELKFGDFSRDASMPISAAHRCEMPYPLENYLSNGRWNAVPWKNLVRRRRRFRFLGGNVFERL